MAVAESRKSLATNGFPAAKGVRYRYAILGPNRLSGGRFHRSGDA